MRVGEVGEWVGLRDRRYLSRVKKLASRGQDGVGEAGQTVAAAQGKRQRTRKQRERARQADRRTTCA